MILTGRGVGRDAGIIQQQQGTRLNAATGYFRPSAETRRDASRARAYARARSSWPALALLWRIATRIGLLMVILQAYSLFRKTYFQRPAEVAFGHALDVIDLQAALGFAVTSVELPLQQRVLEHPWLVDFFNLYYQQFKPALYVCALLCLLLAPAASRRYWRVFLIATVIALPCYALYPLAPPRLMAPFGYPFVDTMAVYGGSQPSSAGLGGANQFAAMPSMHIGWTIIAACWLAAAVPWRRAGAILGSAHVALMCVTVVVTGNHYVLDIVAGAAVAGIAIALERYLSSLSLGARWSLRGRTWQRAPAARRVNGLPPTVPP